ncbi:UNVERIFIED_CONTAM: hypothetical protein Sradi_1916000 [Sesamum radiatum]|uniref:Uncharacterized protein n=1 Tax=Sesamum radiatum TaxID=300843 RepID=A0AAW2TDN7_SESRA
MEKRALAHQLNVRTAKQSSHQERALSHSSNYSPKCSHRTKVYKISYNLLPEKRLRQNKKWRGTLVSSSGASSHQKSARFVFRSLLLLPNVFSTTLPHLIATNSAHLIMPLVPIRERLKEKVEDHFGCEYELFVEFTGLISWCKGASIGWHSDDNRDYLKQRDFAAVCYLNSYGVDFDGGLFHFQDGEPSTVAPIAGVDFILYPD